MTVSPVTLIMRFITDFEMSNNLTSRSLVGWGILRRAFTYLTVAQAASQQKYTWFFTKIGISTWMFDEENLRDPIKVLTHLQEETVRYGVRRLGVLRSGQIVTPTREDDCVASFEDLGVGRNTTQGAVLLERAKSYLKRPQLRARSPELRAAAIVQDTRTVLAERLTTLHDRANTIDRVYYYLCRRAKEACQ